MSIVPASALTASDLARLGNNVSPAGPTRPRPRRPDLRAVNRSLASCGERVGRLDRPSGRIRTAVAAPAA